MKRSNLVIFLLPLLALFGAVWMLVLSPKRQQAAELETEVAGLQAELSAQEELAAGAEVAREEFPRAYRRLVVLGKATPEDDDTSSLLVQLDRIAGSTGVKFIALSADAGAAEAAPPPVTAPQTPAQTAEQSEQKVGNVEAGAPAVPAPATEAQASLLPIGASIGPAGLPVMRYSLSFQGDFSRLADFLEGLDGMVSTRPDGGVGVKGRLITVDSFDLAPAGSGPSENPDLTAEFTITTYLTPADQGATAGASPAGPAPVSATPPAPPTATASTTTP